VDVRRNKPNNRKTAYKFLIRNGADEGLLFGLELMVVSGVSTACAQKRGEKKKTINRKRLQSRHKNDIKLLLESASIIEKFNSNPRMLKILEDDLPQSLYYMPKMLRAYSGLLATIGADLDPRQRIDETFRRACKELVKYVKEVTGKPHFPVVAVICREAIVSVIESPR
jgi:hypothetical protein